MHQVPQSASTEQFGTNSYPANAATSAAGERQPSDVARVGDDLPRFTEEEREAAIVRAAAAQAHHDVQWVLTGCFAAKGDADRARRLKELLIAGRKA